MVSEIQVFFLMAINYKEPTSWPLYTATQYVMAMNYEILNIIMGMKIFETRSNGPLNFLCHDFNANLLYLSSFDGILMVKALNIDH